MTWLMVFLVLFGIGCFLGIIVGFMRGTPLVISGVKEAVSGIKEGWRKGSEDARRIEAEWKSRNSQPANRQ